MSPTLTWERVAHHTHLYILPAAGAVSLGMGILAVAGVRWELGRFLPLALVVAGFAALLGSVGSYMCLAPRDEEALRSDVHAPPIEATLPSVPADSNGTLRVVKPAPELRPHSGIGRATMADFHKMEDELWRRWAAPQQMSLGAPVVGPVPETVYSPHISGGFAAFPERDADIVVLGPDPGTKSPAPTRSPVRSPPPATADRVRETKLSRRGTAETDRRALWTSPAAIEEVATPLLDRAATPMRLDAFDHIADLESINPILPRLRSSSPTAPARWFEKPSPPAAGAPVRRLCAECSRHLSDFRSWVECRVCRRPVCRECLQESLQGSQGGTCSDCRDERKWSARSGAPSRIGERSPKIGSARA